MLTNYDRLFEHRTRLGVCVLLSKHDRISFSRFKELLEETDGNLGAQLKKLEEAEYIKVDKQFSDRKPISWYSMTGKGKKALKRHLDVIEELIASVK